jgi:hypothetical protein
VGEEMTQLVPSSLHGWHVLGLALARTKNYAAAATAYETGFKAAREDEMEHATLLRYCHIESLLNRGQFWIAEVRRLVEEAKQLENQLRPLGLQAGRSAERKVVSNFLKSMDKDDVEDGFVELGVQHVHNEQERQALFEAAPKDSKMFTVPSVVGDVFNTTCSGCNRPYKKVLRCGRCKQAK